MEEPSEGLGDWERTHDCGTLTDKDIGQHVLLMGWVWRRRDHGGVIFIDLRDRYGITQIVFNPQRDPIAYQQANHLRNEYVIAVQGEVEARPEGMVNPQLPTGTIEKPSENSIFHLIRLSSTWIMAIWIKASLWRVNPS